MEGWFDKLSMRRAVRITVYLHFNRCMIRYHIFPSGGQP
jgi:hypothetical protein